MRRLLATLLLLVGCTAIDLPRYQDPERSLGRERFIARCSGCHSLPDPRGCTPEAWGETLDKMTPRAKLTPEERRAVELYLRSAAAP